MKKKSIKTLKLKLDKIFSEYIRHRDSDKFGNCTCCTCGKVLPWKEIHNGHWISRGKLATRFDERNCSSQCCGCNTFKNGEPQKYWIFQEKKHGRKVMDELIQKSNEIVKLTPSWYEEQILFYKDIVKGYED